MDAVPFLFSSPLLSVITDHHSASPPDCPAILDDTTMRGPLFLPKPAKVQCRSHPIGRDKKWDDDAWAWRISSEAPVIVGLNSKEEFDLFCDPNLGIGLNSVYLCGGIFDFRAMASTARQSLSLKGAGNKRKFQRSNNKPGGYNKGNKNRGKRLNFNNNKSPNDRKIKGACWT